MFMFWKHIKMKKLLIISWLICAASSAMPDTYPNDQELPLRLVASLNVPRCITEMIFRHHSDKTAVKELFEQHRYPKRKALIDVSALYDRGYSLSVKDPFFLVCCNHIAELADAMRPQSQPIVLDIGCGNGDTTVLFSLLGANTTGFELYMSQKEALSCQAFMESARKTARVLGQDFVFHIKKRDVTQLDRKEFPDNLADVIFMGCFLHMFDPFTAKKIVKEHILRMVKPDGIVFATADGIGSVPEIQEIYQQRKTNHERFPTIYMRTTLKRVIETEDSLRYEHIENTTRYFSDDTIVDDQGKTTHPCRQSVVEPVKEDTALVRISTIFCAYDTQLINYVFPPEDWDVSLEINIPVGKNILRINLAEEPDMSCKRWHITVRKKQAAAATAAAA